MAVTIHDAQWSYHDVPGHTLAEVAQHISQMAEAGQTAWHANYHPMRWEGQTIAEAQVDVTISVTMPHWANSSAAPAEEQTEWDRFVAALQAHEQGHIDLATQYLQSADTLIEGHDEHTARRQWDDNLHNLNAASQQYDAGNNHGENEGTIINLP